jgi:oxygen-independent coproporphyrinogen III oxidase
MCWFCGCYTKIVNRYEPIQAYLSSLHGEIALIAESLPARFTVRHLHFGGGSPTMVAPDDWLAMMAALRRRFDFAMDAEIAVELDPRDASEDYVAALAAAGVNRASIGVQDFDPECTARYQPHSAIRGNRARHRLAAAPRYRQSQSRHDVRLAATDRGEGRSHGGSGCRSRPR